MSAPRKIEYVADGVKYEQGPPCKYGHPGIRYIKRRGRPRGGCVHCHTARNRGEKPEQEVVLRYVLKADWTVEIRT